MLLILASAMLPLLVPAQNASNTESAQDTSVAPSQECITLAKKHESQCRPVFSHLKTFFQVCKTVADCSSEEKEEAIEPICSNIDTIKECYTNLTPICYPQKFSDSVLIIFQSECKTVIGNSGMNTTNADSGMITTTTDSTNVTESNTVSDTSANSTSGTLYLGVNLFAVLVAVLAI
jgi:hypothetical protein